MNASFLPRLTACVAAAGLLACAAGAVSAAPLRAGLLECTVAPGIGLVVASSRSLSCVYTPRFGHREFYSGSITRVGLDLGFTTGGHFTWAVVDAGRVFAPHSLAGQFVGAGGEATLGGGFSANALVGGNGRSITLQPLSVGLSQGVNLSLGVGAIALTPAAGPPRG